MLHHAILYCQGFPLGPVAAVFQGHCLIFHESKFCTSIIDVLIDIKPRSEISLVKDYDKTGNEDTLTKRNINYWSEYPAADSIPGAARFS
jgi:hypothetical protein